MISSRQEKHSDTSLVGLGCYAFGQDGNHLIGYWTDLIIHDVDGQDPVEWTYRIIPTVQERKKDS